jgi:hypothetical protein
MNRPKRGDLRTSRAPERKPGPYKVAGRTHDGVEVLAPKTKSTHFTRREIRETIDSVIRANKDHSAPKS